MVLSWYVNAMVKKIANITLVHECDEKNCHLDNKEQTKWIENILPKEKLEWNSSTEFAECLADLFT